MKNRFDFEQEFLACWNLSADLGNLLLECEKIGDPEVADHISNIVLGLKSIYDMRFNIAWETFEDLVRNRELNT